MAVTTTEYTQSGSTVIYPFDFPYLKTEDVKVSLDGTNTTAFTFATATSIQLNSAPSAGVKVLIYRNTDVDTAQAVFSSGSSYRATDLNNNFDQSLYFSQEVADTDNPSVAATLDEDNMVSNSATRAPSQQSVKAYVDSLNWLDQSTKEDGSVIYWKNSSSKYFADNAQNIKTLNGGNF